MHKLFSALLVLVAVAFFGGRMNSVQAIVAPNISVRIEQPKSPTNQNNFNLTFVVLDRQGRTLTAHCLKSAPGDSGVFSQFGSDIALQAGGNTNTCQVTGSLMNTDGSYDFKVQAVASDAETVTSSQVTVQYVAGGPGTPNSYTKDHPSSCQYVIKFHTADDAGKTSNVKIYRGDTLSFSIDGSTQVGTVWLGSNMDGSFTDNVPDCNKTWYYAIRAFDGAGNGSGVVGDSQTTTIAGSPAPTSGAIAVRTGTGAGSVLGGGTGVTGGEILGSEASPEPTATPAGSTGLGGALGGMTGMQKLGLSAVVLVVILLGVYLRRRSA